MRDEIVEQLIKCKPAIGLTVLKYVSYILCALGIVFFLIGGGLVGILVAVAFGIAGYYAGVYSQVEYEYVYCNKELDIDVIYSQSKRKTLVSLELGKMEALVRVEGSKMNEYSRRECKTSSYTTNDKANKDKVYALFYDGNVKVLLEPNEKLLGAISYIAPRKVYKD